MIKDHKHNLTQQLNFVTDIKQLNTFTSTSIETIHTDTRVSFRFKTVRKARFFYFWTSKLNCQRNHFTALSRKMKPLRQLDTDYKEHKSLSTRFAEQFRRTTS